MLGLIEMKKVIELLVPTSFRGTLSYNLFFVILGGGGRARAAGKEKRRLCQIENLVP